MLPLQDRRAQIVLGASVAGDERLLCLSQRGADSLRQAWRLEVSDSWPPEGYYKALYMMDDLSCIARLTDDELRAMRDADFKALMNSTIDAADVFDDHALDHDHLEVVHEWQFVRLMEVQLLASQDLSGSGCPGWA